MNHMLRRCGLAGGIIAAVAVAGPAGAVAINDLVVVAANTTAQTDVPMGQQQEQTSLLPEDAERAGEGDLFGLEGGYFHPYLNVQGEFTDNLYNSNTNEVDNILTRISPGIWFALPRKKVIPITLVPHNTSPGGLQNQLEDRTSPDRFISYALAGADFKLYSENSDLDDTDFVLEGLVRYNMRGGLSLQLVDRFNESEDSFTTDTITRASIRRRFNTNFLMATVDWDMTEKLRFQADYSNFYLEYEEESDDNQNRTDNGVDLYGYFKYSEKTSFFLQYRFVDVAYDKALENDSDQDFYFGGIQWNTTEKLALLFKAGYQDRSFDAAERDGYDGLALDLQAKYRYSQKTTADLSLYRTNEETDSQVASDKTVLGVSFRYNQEFTDKISGNLALQYEDAEYTQLIDETRDEQTYFARPALRYLFKEWLRAELAYEYERVDSTQDFLDYTSNTVILGLNVAL